MPLGEKNIPERIYEGIEKGELNWQKIDEAVAHILTGMGKCGLLSLVKLKEDGSIEEDDNPLPQIAMEYTYDQKVKEGLLEENAGVAERIVEKGAILLKNENDVLPLTPNKYSSVAMIKLGAESAFTGENQERSYGRLSKFKSHYIALKEQGIFEDIESEIGIDLIGEAIAEEMLFQDNEGKNPGLIRTFGIAATDYSKLLPNGSMGGGFEIFSRDMPVEPLTYQGKKLGEKCCIDDKISFCTGMLDGKPNVTYKNSKDGKAFLQGEVYTWEGYIRAPETGEYEMIFHSIGGEAAWLMDVGEDEILLTKMRPREGAQWSWSSLLCTKTGMDIVSTEFILKRGNIII